MKKLKSMTLALSASLLLFGCSQTDAANKQAANEQQNLTVSTFAINEDTIKQDIFEPFTANEGIDIQYEVGNSGERFTKLKNNPNHTIDVVELSQINASTGMKDDMFEPLTEDKVPNLKLLIDNAKDIVSDAGAPFTINSIGIIYNPKTAGIEINDWSDLWNPALKGKISIPDITTTFGPAMLHVASDYAGVDITSDKGEAAFKALQELKPNITKTYTKSSDLANLFQSGEIVAAVVGDFGYPMIHDANPDVEYIYPESGSYANYNTINVLKSSKNKEAAYKFINWRISQELQEKTATSLNESPSNSKVELDEAAAANKTYGEAAKRAQPIDFNFVNENLDQWLNQWNEILNQ